jgi:hypothetical protein
MISRIQMFSAKTLHAFISPMCTTCPAHFFLDFINLIISQKYSDLPNSSLYSLSKWYKLLPLLSVKVISQICTQPNRKQTTSRCQNTVTCRPPWPSNRRQYNSRYYGTAPRTRCLPGNENTWKTCFLCGPCRGYVTRYILSRVLEIMDVLTTYRL